jgi:hypothetical protein
MIRACGYWMKHFSSVLKDTKHGPWGPLSSYFMTCTRDALPTTWTFYYDYFIVTYFTNFATSSKLHFISSKISKSTSQNPFIRLSDIAKTLCYVSNLFIYFVPYNKRTYNRHSSYEPAPSWCAHCIIVVLVGWISGECPHRLRGWFESWKKTWFRHGRTVVCVITLLNAKGQGY